MKETRDFLKHIGMPSGDLYDLPTSEKRFEDGGQYRFEVPGIQGPGPMKALLESLDGFGIQIHRVTQTQGIMRLLDSEIEQMLEYARKWNVELLLATGPRATIDTSASVNTPEGVRMGYRLRSGADYPCRRRYTTCCNDRPSACQRCENCGFASMLLF